MAKLSVRVSADDFFGAYGGPGIVGPDPEHEGSGWVVYIPGMTPCICDSLEDAAELLGQYPESSRKKSR